MSRDLLLTISERDFDSLIIAIQHSNCPAHELLDDGLFHLAPAAEAGSFRLYCPLTRIVASCLGDGDLDTVEGATEEGHDECISFGGDVLADTDLRRLLLRWIGEPPLLDDKSRSYREQFAAVLILGISASLRGSDLLCGAIHIPVFHPHVVWPALSRLLPTECTKLAATNNA